MAGLHSNLAARGVQPEYAAPSPRRPLQPLAHQGQQANSGLTRVLCATSSLALSLTRNMWGHPECNALKPRRAAAHAR